MMPAHPVLSTARGIAACVPTILLLLLLAAPHTGYAGGRAAATAPLVPAGQHYSTSHDLRLPAWGPYSNAYLGLSHVADQRRGLRFDITAFAGPHTTTTPNVPNAALNTGMLAWDAAPDLSYYAYRQQIEGKQLYAEISYAALDRQTRVMRATLRNDSGRNRTLVFNLLASLQLPNRAPNALLEPRRIVQPSLPAGARWIGALPYLEFASSRPDPRQRLVYDGWLRGEQRGDGRVDGRSLKLENGDTVRYRIGAVLPGQALLLRYRPLAQASMLRAEGLAASDITLPAGPDYATALLPLPEATAAGAGHTVSLAHAGGGAVDLDGFAVLGQDQVAQVRFDNEDRELQPQAEPGPVPDSLVLKYRQLDHYYGVRWYRGGTFVREYRNGVLDGFFARNSMRRTARVLEGDRRGHYTAVQFNGRALAAGAEETIWAVVTEGTRDEVTRALSISQDQAGAAHEGARRLSRASPASPQGERYALARQLIRANLLMNVVYPVYTQDQYIRHFTPGKWWDSLYTWDSGFIGIGMSAVAPALSADILNAYTTAPGAQSAFIQHGTPLPVQHSQFLELWNGTQDRTLLEHAYPRLKQYYEFLVGRAEGSRTAVLQSGLLQTWDYFYNSGGWDDYPAQAYVHAAGLTQRSAPMVTTSHVIRAARILRMAALESGRADDAARYEADIARLGEAIQRHAWDEASGYFGYVAHDKEGNPTGLLRLASGELASKGLDGVQPLVAGVATPQQSAALLRHLGTPGHLWSAVGITAVDQRAGYFDPAGYWNGTVWFPHQWFVWKTLLDQGRADMAWRVAQTALSLYQREAEQSWTSAEHFEIRTGQGVGWHQFSGLSAPIASWFAAYFEPGRLSTGYDVWVRKREPAPGMRGMDADLAIHSPRTDGHIALQLTLAPGRYQATWNDKRVEVSSLMPGVLSINLPLNAAREGKLRVRPVQRPGEKS